MVGFFLSRGMTHGNVEVWRCIGNIPLWRWAGVASTTDWSASLRVATMMGPGGPCTGSPRRTITCDGFGGFCIALLLLPRSNVVSQMPGRTARTSEPVPMSASANPTRPAPTMVNACMTYLTVLRLYCVYPIVQKRVPVYRPGRPS